MAHVLVAEAVTIQLASRCALIGGSLTAYVILGCSSRSRSCHSNDLCASFSGACALPCIAVFVFACLVPIL